MSDPKETKETLASPTPETTRSRRAVAISAERFEGPIPPPELLIEYERIEQGLAGRIVAMAEAEQKHRQLLEQAMVIKGLHTERWGILSAWTIALCFLGASAWLIAGGHEAAGTVLGTVDLVALASLFIYGKRKQIQYAEYVEADGPSPSEEDKASAPPN